MEPEQQSYLDSEDQEAERTGARSTLGANSDFVTAVR